MINRKCPLTALVLLSIALFIPTLSQDYFNVKRVIDGETLLLKDGQRVRLMGVDTPEARVFETPYRDAEGQGRDVKTIRQLRKRASDFVEYLVKPGDRIVLKYDRQRIDKYGRNLGMCQNTGRGKSHKNGYDR